MDIFESNPQNVVKTITKLIKNNIDSYDEPVICKSTAKMAVLDIARNVFSNDMEMNNFLRQAQIFLADEYWEQIVKNVQLSEVGKSNKRFSNTTVKTSNPGWNFLKWLFIITIVASFIKYSIETVTNVDETSLKTKESFVEPDISRKSSDGSNKVKSYGNTKERIPESCYPLPEGIEVTLNEAGANSYESGVIALALEKDLVEAFEAYLSSHLKYGCNDNGCRAGLIFEMKLKSFSHDLNGDGKDEVFVEFDDVNRCGSSGCQTYVLDGSSHKVLFSGRPVIISKETKNGYQIVYNAVRNYKVPLAGTACPYNFVKQ
jgi:hypothetical protein